MDFLERDDDDDDDDVSGSAQTNALFVELMKIKPILPHESVYFGRTVLIAHEIGCAQAVSLRQRLVAAKFQCIDMSTTFDARVQYDVVIDMTLGIRQSADDLYQCTAPSGWLITAIDCFQYPEQWVLVNSLTSNLRRFRKRVVGCNITGAIYWTNSPDFNITDERRRIDDITICVSQQERVSGIFSDATRQNAIDSLDRHGVCIFPGLFDVDTVRYWRDAVTTDMHMALQALKTRGIDLLTPGLPNQPKIENFHELSMREGLRCDLRNGTHMRQASGLSSHSRCALPRVPLCRSDLTRKTTADSESEESEERRHANLRNHPGIAAVLLELMNPGQNGPLAKGNWGRWNFEGGGPESGPPPMTIGEIGAVMSLCGSSDQTIHADTAHLLVHQQLPGHYFNLFVPAMTQSEEEVAVGQTVYVLGSHALASSAEIMTGARGQLELEQNLVRPHLHAGDALIFDCRVLHFGLANQSTTDWRPMLYINHHQQWFHDPKNWNDREKLFD